MKKHIEGPVLKLDRGFDCELFETPHQIGQVYIPSLNEDVQPLLQRGTIIVADRNFRGSSADLSQAFQAAGVACIIAAAYSRSFYRNCINLGLPIIENSDAFGKIAVDETITVDFDSNQIACKKGAIHFTPYPEIIMRIIDSGGLIPHIKRSLGK